MTCIQKQAFPLRRPVSPTLTTLTRSVAVFKQLWILFGFLHMAMLVHHCDGLGVNWGIQASHPLSPSIVVQLLRSNGISKVKLFDYNSSVVSALAGSGIEVMIGIPNDNLQALTDAAQATAWVKNNVVRYQYTNGVNIRYVAVGNEPFLTSYNNSFNLVTLPALKNVQTALNAAGLGNTIKATVPMNADVIQAPLPSTATFRTDISQIMMQIVEWLNQNGAPFMINIYPFISLYNDKSFPIDYAFFEGTQSPVVDGQYTYQNVFDASYDSLFVTLSNAGFSSMKVIVGEIGWPSDGDVNANLQYAQKFNQGFLNHMANNAGTPRRPNQAIDFYLFGLIDEDMKSISPGNFERHWGIFLYDGRPKYSLKLSGANGANLVQATGVQYMTKQWCIYSPGRGDASKLGDSITYACSNSDCTSLGYGCSCNTYLTAEGNASFAFNQYFQRQDQGTGTCDFNGLGQVVSSDPSKGACEFMIQIASSLSSSSSSSSASHNTHPLPSFPLFLFSTFLLIIQLTVLRI